MVYNAKDMYGIAEAKVLKDGPRILNIEGKRTAAYALNKGELRNLFSDHGYSMRRHTWIENIKDWAWMKDAVIPREIDEPNNWTCHVIFRYMTPEQFTALQMFAEDNDAYRFPDVLA